jgi:hypothetical protein
MARGLRRRKRRKKKVKKRMCGAGAGSEINGGDWVCRWGGVRGGRGNEEEVKNREEEEAEGEQEGDNIGERTDDRYRQGQIGRRRGERMEGERRREGEKTKRSRCSERNEFPAGSPDWPDGVTQ